MKQEQTSVTLEEAVGGDERCETEEIKNYTINYAHNVYPDILVLSSDAEKRNKQEKESTVGEQEQTSVTLEEAVGEV